MRTTPAVHPVNTCYVEISHWFEPYSHTLRWFPGSCDPVFVVEKRGHHHSRYKPCQHWQGLKKISNPPRSAPGRQDKIPIFYNLPKTPPKSLSNPSNHLTHTLSPIWRQVVWESENIPQNTHCFSKDEGMGSRWCRIEKGLETSVIRISNLCLCQQLRMLGIVILIFLCISCCMCNNHSVSALSVFAIVSSPSV